MEVSFRPISSVVNGSVTGSKLAPNLSYSTNGAASLSGLKLSGAVFSGGTGTTTVPWVCYETTGAPAVTSWNTAGTILGVSVPVSFSGNLLDFKSNGTTVLRVDGNGNIVCGANHGIGAYTTHQIRFYGGYIEIGQQAAIGTKFSAGGSIYGPSANVLSIDRILGIRPGAAATASPLAGEWRFFVDSSDGNKLKAIASTGTIVLIGTP